jgi:hypothetical protein
MPPRELLFVSVTPIWRGDLLKAKPGDTDTTKQMALADGLQFVTADKCFFVPARTLWDELDKLMDGKKK